MDLARWEHGRRGSWRRKLYALAENLQQGPLVAVKEAGVRKNPQPTSLTQRSSDNLTVDQREDMTQALLCRFVGQLRHGCQSQTNRYSRR